MPNAIVIDCESTKTPLIEQAVQKAGWQTKTFNWKKIDLNIINTYDAVIISGGPYLFTESKATLTAIFTFIPSLTIPTLGICLGSQAIALSLGGEVYRGKERRTEDSMTIHQPYPLFQGLSTGEVFKEDHCEGIHATKNMTVLASSEHYPVEAFAANNQPFLGVQFHPESSGENGQKLISNFLSWANDYNV